MPIELIMLNIIVKINLDTCMSLPDIREILMNYYK